MARFLPLIQEIKASFSHLEFSSTKKGRAMENLRKKLRSLSSGTSNEVVGGAIEQILNRFRERRHA